MNQAAVLAQIAKVYGARPAISVGEEVLLNFTQFEFQQLFIPPGILCNLVVGDHQRLALCLSQMSQHDDRYLFQTELLRGHQSTMTGNNDIVITDQYRINETKPPH